MDIQMKIIPEKGFREVLSMNTVVHCHHYNATIQKTITSISAINGNHIFRSSAASVFYKTLQANYDGPDTVKDRLAFSFKLYKFLGFGRLVADRLVEGVITASHSHFAEGYRVGVATDERCVCMFTEGFLEAALSFSTQSPKSVREEKCTYSGAEECLFNFKEAEKYPEDYLSTSTPGDSSIAMPALKSENVDLEKITAAVFDMDLSPNATGLIPAFNVYLAHMPADFYNLITCRLLDQLDQLGMKEVAFNMLYQDAERCGLNTFSGIMNSDEWEVLISPMIKITEDNILALNAVQNALGWGITKIVNLQGGTFMQMETTSSYESVKVEFAGVNLPPYDCPMLQGVGAGIMELIYTPGDFETRMGDFHSVETNCTSRGDKSCIFEIKKV